MSKVKIAMLLISLVGALVFFRAYYLVSFAVGYGIKEADRNQRLFLLGTAVCAVVFLVSATSLYLRARRGH